MLLSLVLLFFYLSITTSEADSFLDWAHFAQQANKSNCWICELMAVSRTSVLLWWVQGEWITVYTLQTTWQMCQRT
jgi:hypothetical protein